MVHVQKKIAVGMDVLSFFAMSNWDFKSDHFSSLVDIQSKEEYNMFPVDTKNLGDTLHYLRTSLVGGRQYCARDPLSTVPKAKILIKV